MRSRKIDNVGIALAVWLLIPAAFAQVAEFETAKAKAQVDCVLSAAVGVRGKPERLGDFPSSGKEKYLRISPDGRKLIAETN